MKRIRLALTILAVLALAPAAPGPASTDSHWTPRSNFGRELGAGSGGGSAAAPKAAEATGVSWVEETETP